VDAGLPIGGEPGGSGGLYWIATEPERQAVLIMLRAQLRGLQRRVDAGQHAQLDGFQFPAGQERLFR
jgi:hypothetical protein